MLCGGVIAAGRRWAGRRSAGVRISARPKTAAPEPPANSCGSAKGWQPGPSDDARPASGPADHGAGPGCVCVLPHTIGGAPHRRPQAGRPLGTDRPQGAGGGRPRFSPPAAGERPAKPALKIARPQRARGNAGKSAQQRPTVGPAIADKAKKRGLTAPDGCAIIIVGAAPPQRARSSRRKACRYMAKAEASRGCSLGGLFLFISPACGYERRAGGLHYADTSRGDREVWLGPCRESARGRGRRLRQRHSDMAKSYRGGYGRPIGRGPNAARQAAGAIPQPERRYRSCYSYFDGRGSVVQW